MTQRQKIQLFEDKKVRTAWDDQEEKWYFSIVDVCGVLTEQPDYDGAKNYWKVLKFRLKEEGNESVTKCNQLKMVSPKDGKRYNTDVADTEQLFRLIQSIPSKKAEPFKQWMAQVARERLDQMADMASFDEQMPCVRIFWYDPQEHSFFGVHKKEITPKMVEEARAKGVDVIDYPISSLLHQTSDIKRSEFGRVAWNIDKFIVLVGKWAEPIQDELSDLLEKEFSLPYFEFVYDEHWDLGQGWSGDMPGTR